MSGMASLEAFIERVESLRAMNERAAEEAEKPVAEIARASARAGKAPDGTPWPERADGGRALAGADGAIESTTVGNRIVLKIGKPWVYHHHGAGGHSQTKEAVRARSRGEAHRAKNGITNKFHAPRRQILPEGDAIPDAMKEAVADAAKRVFEKAMGAK